MEFCLKVDDGNSESKGFWVQKGGLISCLVVLNRFFYLIMLINLYYEILKGDRICSIVRIFLIIELFFIILWNGFVKILKWEMLFWLNFVGEFGVMKIQELDLFLFKECDYCLE